MEKHNLNVFYIRDGNDLFINVNSIHDYEKLTKLINNNDKVNTKEVSSRVIAAPTEVKQPKLSVVVVENKTTEKDINERHTEFLKTIVKIKGSRVLNRYNNLDSVRRIENICRQLKSPFEIYATRTYIGLRVADSENNTIKGVFKIEPKPRLCFYTSIYVPEYIIRELTGKETIDTNINLTLKDKKYTGQQDYYYYRFLFNSAEEFEIFVNDLIQSVRADSLFQTCTAA